jgi:hypothetical protein
MAGTPVTPVAHGSKATFSSCASSSTCRARGESSLRDQGNTRASISFGKFWVTTDDIENDEDEEVAITTPTKEEIVVAAMRAGFSVEDLIQVENEIDNMEKVSCSSPSRAEFRCSSPSSTEFRCPLSSKIIKAIVRGKSLKHYEKPWQGSLPKPRISPPKTIGDAVIKNSFIRLRGDV